MTAPSSAPLPVTAFIAVDAVQRDAAVMGVLADVPDAVVVRHDLSAAAGGPMRRVVSDVTGVLEDVELPIEHACLTCALREDLLPTLARLSALGRWSAALLAVPVAGEPVPVVRALALGEVAGRPVREHVVLAGVIAVVDGDRVVADLVGDDLLTERGLAHSDDDERSVGEVLAHQLRGADLVLVSGSPSPQARALLEHLVPGSALRWCGPEEVPGTELLAPRHEEEASRRWDDPRFVEPTSAQDGRGVWTLDLADWRPLHPQRLMDGLEQLGAGRLVSRGRFWLPTRPDVVGIWDGAGGQLSIGDAGPWDGEAPSTRLVVTGVDEDPERVRAAFTAALLTDAELAAGLAEWAGRPDGFEAWMGEVSTGADADEEAEAA